MQDAIFFIAVNGNGQFVKIFVNFFDTHLVFLRGF